MATITMDTSEYEALKKNIALLEEAKARENYLNNEIQTLKDEKIQALKDNEKSVTIVRQNVTHEYVMQRRNSSEIINHLRHYISSRNLGSRGLDYAFDNELDSLINVFFSKEKMISHPLPQETITVKGLDEYKEEMKAEYFATLTKETTESLKKIKFLEEEYAKVSPELEQTRANNIKLVELNSNLRDSLNSTNEEFKNTKEDITKFNKNLYSILNSNWTIWNFKTKQEQIKELYKI